MINGKKYRVPFTSITISEQRDLWEVTGVAGKICSVAGYVVSQKTDVGDANEEQLTLVMKLGNTLAASGSGGFSVTPVPQDNRADVAGFTVECCNTVKMSTVGGGTITVWEPRNWNIRVAEPVIFTPEFMPKILAGERFTIELASTPNTPIVVSGVLWVIEQG